MAGRIVNVSEAIDGAKVSSLTLRVVIVSALIIFIDGLDTTNIGYVAPAMIQAWHISEPSVFGPVFGASALGIFFGATLLGYIGDRFGRRKAIFVSCLIFAVFTWAAVLTSSVRELTLVRLLCGVGIGGVMPNLIALVAEFAPKRLRATLVVVMFSGIGLGAGMPGPIAAWLIPALWLAGDLYDRRRRGDFGGVRLPCRASGVDQVLCPQSAQGGRAARADSHPAGSLDQFRNRPSRCATKSSIPASLPNIFSVTAMPRSRFAFGFCLQ